MSVLGDFEPVHRCCEAEHAEESAGGLLVAGGDGAPLLQPRPEILDEVAVVVDPCRAGDLLLIALGRDRRTRAHVPDVLAESMRSEAAVAHDPKRRLRQTVQEAGRERQLMGLTRRERETDGAPAAVRDHARLRAVAAARAAERLARVPLCLAPPFRAAPAAFWCARMVVPSRNAMPSATPRSCARSSRRSHTPRWPQRLKVWAAIHHGPSSAGMARQVAPFRCRQIRPAGGGPGHGRCPRWCAAGRGARSCRAGGPPRSAAKAASTARPSCPKYGNRPQDLTGPSGAVLWLIQCGHGRSSRDARGRRERSYDWS